MTDMHAELGPLGGHSSATPSGPLSGELRSHAASPAPPDDPTIDTATITQLLAKMNTVQTKSFSMTDIIRDERLAHAAAHELRGATTANPVVIETAAADQSTGASLTRLMLLGSHEAELERQRGALNAIEQDVLEEIRVNKEVADLILERMECSRRSLEGMLKQLQLQASAASSYASALHAASKLRVDLTSASGAGDPLEEPLSALNHLPTAISGAHRQLHASLTLLAHDVQKLLERYKAASKEVGSEAVTLQKNIESARRALSSQFQAHCDACGAFDAVLAERAEGRGARGPELDPWATEVKVVQEHKGLQRWQDKERSFLKTAFSRARELEAARLELSRNVLAAVADAYRAAAVPVQMDLAVLGGAAEGLAGHTRPLEDLTKAASTAAEVAEALAARQTESIQGVCVELFCSPEIMRQGDLEAWDSTHSTWLQGHCVLTRAGFLHWFKSVDDTVPADTLNLARCAFEAGQPPCFNITEERGLGRWGLGKTRKLTYQASGVEDCCEWAIAIREAISVGRGNAAWQGS